jgi:hypothetical protein
VCHLLLKVKIQMRKKRAGKEVADDGTKVYAVQRKEPQVAQANAVPSQLSTLEGAIEKLQRSFDSMVSKLDENAKAKTISHGRRRKHMGPCYKCGKKGHIKPDSPLLQQNPKSDLNSKGLRQ